MPDKAWGFKSPLRHPQFFSYSNSLYLILPYRCHTYHMLGDLVDGLGQALVGGAAVEPNGQCRRRMACQGLRFFGVRPAGNHKYMSGDIVLGPQQYCHASAPPESGAAAGIVASDFLSTWPPDATRTPQYRGGLGRAGVAHCHGVRTITPPHRAAAGGPEQRRATAGFPHASSPVAFSAAWYRNL